MIPKLQLYGENLEMLIFSITHAIEPLFSNSAVVVGWLQSTMAQNTDTAPGLCNKGDYFLQKRMKGICVYVLELMLTLDTHGFVYRVFWPIDWVIFATHCLNLEPRLLVRYPRLLKFCVHLANGVHLRI